MEMKDVDSFCVKIVINYYFKLKAAIHGITSLLIYGT